MPPCQHSLGEPGSTEGTRESPACCCQALLKGMELQRMSPWISWFVLFEHTAPAGLWRTCLGALSLSLQWHRGMALFLGEEFSLWLRPWPGLCFAFPAVMFNICPSIPSALGFRHRGVCSDGWLGNCLCGDAWCCKRLFLFLGVEKLPLDKFFVCPSSSSMICID